MPIDQENVRKAIDSFVDDDYVASKELLKKEIKKAKNDWIKNKLELDNDVVDDIEDVEDEIEDDTEEE